MDGEKIIGYTTFQIISVESEGPPVHHGIFNVESQRHPLQHLLLVCADVGCVGEIVESAQVEDNRVCHEAHGIFPYQILQLMHSLCDVLAIERANGEVIDRSS